jgi:hypothetical protein
VNCRSSNPEDIVIRTRVEDEKNVPEEPNGLRERTHLEGHGFSRATDALCANAAFIIAAEVRFFPSSIAGESRNNVPQGLKPSTAGGMCGTAEAVPFRGPSFQAERLALLPNA